MLTDIPLQAFIILISTLLQFIQAHFILVLRNFRRREYTRSLHLRLSLQPCYMTLMKVLLLFDHSLCFFVFCIILNLSDKCQTGDACYGEKAFRRRRSLSCVEVRLGTDETCCFPGVSTSLFAEIDGSIRWFQYVLHHFTPKPIKKFLMTFTGE